MKPSESLNNMHPIFVICERDAGLFSLIQQVIANLPRAFNRSSIPIVYFGRNCCYWAPSGFKGKYNVWEYYFEPLLNNFGSDKILSEVKTFAESAMSQGGTPGIDYNNDYYLSNNFGDHSLLRHECLVIPFEWQDPDDWLRRIASRLIKDYIRPRQFLIDRANAFANQHFQDCSVIGLHIRGTDSLSEAEPRLFRKNSLVFERYLSRIEIEKKRFPNAKIFIATDALDSLVAIQRHYGDDVVHSSTIHHSGGEVAGAGPTGALMPAYISDKPEIAVNNGAEAIVDYLLLRKCNVMIHNGASVARTVLLSDPSMPHHNTHRKTLNTRLQSISLKPKAVRKLFQKWDERIRRNQKIKFEKWHEFLSQI